MTGEREEGPDGPPYYRLLENDFGARSYEKVRKG